MNSLKQNVHFDGFTVSFALACDIDFKFLTYMNLIEGKVKKNVECRVIAIHKLIVHIC